MSLFLRARSKIEEVVVELTPPPRVTKQSLHRARLRDEWLIASTQAGQRNFRSNVQIALGITSVRKGAKLGLRKIATH